VLPVLSQLEVAARAGLRGSCGSYLDDACFKFALFWLTPNTVTEVKPFFPRPYLHHPFESQSYIDRRKRDLDRKQL
jgi:hypothetical protein